MQYINTIHPQLLPLIPREHHSWWLLSSSCGFCTSSSWPSGTSFLTMPGNRSSPKLIWKPSAVLFSTCKKITNSSKSMVKSASLGISSQLGKEKWENNEKTIENPWNITNHHQAILWVRLKLSEKLELASFDPKHNWKTRWPVGQQLVKSVRKLFHPIPEEGHSLRGGFVALPWRYEPEMFIHVPWFSYPSDACQFGELLQEWYKQKTWKAIKQDEAGKICRTLKKFRDRLWCLGAIWSTIQTASDSIHQHSIAAVAFVAFVAFSFVNMFRQTVQATHFVTLSPFSDTWLNHPGLPVFLIPATWGTEAKHSNRCNTL